jgi:hypothetical protein
MAEGSQKILINKLYTKKIIFININSRKIKFILLDSFH